MDTRTCWRDETSAVADAKSKAEQVVDLLQKEACLDEPVKTAGQNAVFARLYFFTTQRWLDYANSCENPVLLYMVVEHFYFLYRRYVGGSTHIDNDATVGHWRIYQRLVRDGNKEHTSAPQTIALILGIRAHTRFDLAEAICFAHSRYQQRSGCAPDTEQFHSLLFGEASEDVFRQASVDFMISIISPSQNGALLKDAFKTFSLMWLPIFQFARKLAWRETRRSIDTGKSIYRYSYPAINGAGN